MLYFFKKMLKIFFLVFSRFYLRRQDSTIWGTFILLNDYRFPVIRPPYGVETLINRKHLDKLENLINSLDEDEECFLLSHYQVDRALLSKSSSGKSFKEIISNKKIGFVFTGHLHPKNVIIIHHGSEGGLEFCTFTLW